MDYRKIDLRTAHIFDLIPDRDFLVNELGYLGPKSNYSNGQAIQSKIMDLVAYAEATKNQQLEKEIDRQFAYEFTQFGFE